MSEQQKPLTYEGVLEMFRRADRRIKKTERLMKETRLMIQEIGKEQEKTDRQLKATGKKIDALGSRIGEIVESMVAGNGNIIDKFETFGYEMTEWGPRKKFANKDLDIRGEVDLFLENGDTAILIEVKTSLETADVRRHIERLEKFRRYADAKGDKRRFIGAVAGAVVNDDAAVFAQENGMFVIVQSGEAVEIVPPPEGFIAKEW